jgi:hypothetical protein
MAARRGFEGDSGDDFRPKSTIPVRENSKVVRIYESIILYICNFTIYESIYTVCVINVYIYI